jgi:hypothetical protein
MYWFTIFHVETFKNISYVFELVEVDCSFIYISIDNSYA